VILLNIKKSKIDEVKEIISQIANLKNRLKDLGVVKRGDKIISDYAKWFCSKKFKLQLCEDKNLGYDALSQYGKKIQIKSIIGSDIDFKININEIQVEKIDSLLIAFIEEKTLMIDSIYQTSHDILIKFLRTDDSKKFEWKRESRSLSLQLYPEEENELSPII
jgi:hypothetical protein